MGMGLSICRSIIEAHDGKLWVMPNKSQGALFQFTLPADVPKRPGLSVIAGTAFTDADTGRWSADSLVRSVVRRGFRLECFPELIQAILKI
jgi:hypothetical protein